MSDKHIDDITTLMQEAMSLADIPIEGRAEIDPEAAQEALRMSKYILKIKDVMYDTAKEYGLNPYDAIRANAFLIATFAVTQVDESKPGGFREVKRITTDMYASAFDAVTKDN